MGSCAISAHSDQLFWLSNKQQLCYIISNKVGARSMGCYLAFIISSTIVYLHVVVFYCVCVCECVYNQ